MNQADLIAKIAELNTRSLSKADIANVLELQGVVATAELKSGGEVTLPAIGKLTVKAKAARTGTNPKTREKIEIPAKKAPAFSASKALKDAVA